MLPKRSLLLDTIQPLSSASIRFTSAADSGTETSRTSPSYTLRLRAPPLRPSSAARLGSEWSAQKALLFRAGAAHGPPALVFALHSPFAVVCRFSGMGDTPCPTDAMIRAEQAIWHQPVSRNYIIGSTIGLHRHGGCRMFDPHLIAKLNRGGCFALVGSGPSTEMGYPTWGELALSTYESSL